MKNIIPLKVLFIKDCEKHNLYLIQKIKYVFN